ncbi:MAG: hypothetical protein O7B23_05155 [Deltaproteobacteria bacterium]|nr:hypothetical protein [Myxococcales bacterium]MCZ6569534.1 hypothetical protein [Deltaproteobacteria bacterium]MCZ6714518.1 hypothetical protein [Deltaproteobacteria bacterium]MCZ6823011.1 hypothetical protein [Deltaproteobacteria bacterium]TDJ02389.1 MAG: hypothetical protein E2O73_02245 [Deltaproteobacteria bacterium]
MSPGECELRAESHGAEPSTVRVRTTRFARRERLKRGARIFFPLFGLALVSLPIPAWHLAAVPGFLLAGIVLGVRRLRQREQVEALEGPCPACGRRQDFAVPARLTLPLTLRCPGCGAFVKLYSAG